MINNCSSATNDDGSPEPEGTSRRECQFVFEAV